MLQIRAVLFDLFGTLVDNFGKQEVDELLRSMAQTLGVPEPAFAEHWNARFEARMTAVWPTLEDTIEGLVIELGHTASRGQILEAATLRRHFTTRQLSQPRPAAARTLSELRRRGFQIGLLSNCTHEVPEIWGTLELATLIDRPYFSCVEHACKPDPRFFRAALAGLQVDPEQCLYVADGDRGEMKAAEELGMPGILIRDAGETEQTHRFNTESWSGRSIQALDELPPLLEMPSTFDLPTQARGPG